MVDALRKWMREWLSVSAMERANVVLAKKLVSLESSLAIQTSGDSRYLDHEARIAYLETRLTEKAASPKIVPRAKHTTVRQFLSAAEKASETEEPE